MDIRDIHISVAIELVFGLLFGFLGYHLARRMDLRHRQKEMIDNRRRTAAERASDMLHRQRVQGLLWTLHAQLIAMTWAMGTLVEDGHMDEWTRLAEKRRDCVMKETEADAKPRLEEATRRFLDAAGRVGHAGGFVFVDAPKENEIGT